VRDNLIRRLRELQREHRHTGDVQMWTLTLDPQGHGSAEEAYDSIRQRERVSKLCTRMGWKYWVCVLEWHKSGWPHWHLVVWEPVARMYYGKHRVQEVWGEGNVSYTGSEGRPGEAAYRYASKYMTKPSEYPVPAWVMDRTYVRMVNASRSWGSVRRSECQDDLAPGADTAPARKSAAVNRVAMATCGKSVTVIREIVDERGQVRREFMFRADVPYRSLRKWMSRVSEGASDRVKVCMRHLRMAPEDPAWSQLRPVLLGCSVQ
jgi:hypothetical protein